MIKENDIFNEGLLIFMIYSEIRDIMKFYILESQNVRTLNKNVWCNIYLSKSYVQRYVCHV